MNSNLHSLLSSAWFIEPSHANSLSLALVNLLNGKTLGEQSSIKKEVPTANISNASASNQEAYIAVVSIKSPIYKYNQECGPRGTKAIMNRLRQYEGDSNCTGVVLDMDTGGGQVYGTPEFHDFLKEFSKPTITYTDGYLCSAGYYIAAGTDQIIANKRADAIGSIGTMIYTIDLKGYYEKQGAKVIEAYATKSTDKNKSFRELSKGNIEHYIKNELDPITDSFHSDIENARPGISKEVFTGGTYNAEKSLELGLIDQIGTLQDAVDSVKSLSKTNQKTDTTMAIEFPKMEAVIGASLKEATSEEGVLLIDGEAPKLEQHLHDQSEQISTLTTERDSANTTAENAQNELTENQNSINALADGFGITKGENTASTIANIEAHIKDLGKQDGASHTNTPKSNQKSSGPQVVSGVNLDDELPY